MKLLSIGELAELTGMSRSTLERWRRKGYLRPYTYAGISASRPRFRMQDFEDAAERVREAVAQTVPDPSPKGRTWGDLFNAKN